jgi:hypothetical protein
MSIRPAAENHILYTEVHLRVVSRFHCLFFILPVRKMTTTVEVVDTPMPHQDDPSESVESDDTDSHDESGSGTSTPNNLTDRSESKVALLHLQHEETQVRKARFILALMTLVFAVTVTVAVYFSARNGEYRKFEEEVRFNWIA